ncbi:hypothetical protein HY417_00605 [Candidatus Kaiserbacteria bacterium]|nr:hypothetical protein [Candidatus Kaiserbacteria bacterium]
MVEQPTNLTREWISKEIAGVRDVIEGAGMEVDSEQRNFMLTRARERIEALEKAGSGSNLDSPGFRTQLSELKRQRDAIPAEHGEEEREIKNYGLDNGNDE